MGGFITPLNNPQQRQVKIEFPVLEYANAFFNEQFVKLPEPFNKDPHNLS